MGAPAWSSYLDAATRQRALAIARGIAESLRDPARLARFIAVAHEQSPMADATAWQPHQMSGDLGLALVFGHLDACFPEQGWQRDAHRHLEAAARHLESLAPAPMGMFAGAAGLGFCAATLARGGARYGRLLQRLDERAAEGAHALADRLLSGPGGHHISEFDLVSGLAGVMAYLLYRPGTPTIDAAVAAGVGAIVALAEDGGGLPRWHTPGAMVAKYGETLKGEYPEGYLDCGAAHGMPGLLMVLSLACERGAGAPGARAAVRHLAEWLLSHRRDDAWGINWPPVVPLSIDEAGRALPVAPSRALGRATARAGWCYGSPGIAPALWRAGVAVDEPRFRDAAVEAVLAALRRPDDERRIDSPTFCHGVAGLLQCVLRLANTSGHPALAEGARALAAQLVAMREDTALLGYRAVEMGGVKVDQPGLVDGAAGVMAALLSATVDVEPAWDRAFLLS